MDNIDLDEATKRGVLVMSTPGGSSVSVAEHTFALLLALVRQVPKFDAAMREGSWEKSSSGAEVRGKTLGLIGLGRIGSEVAMRADAFDMRVLAYDPYISEAAARECRWSWCRWKNCWRRAISFRCTRRSARRRRNDQRGDHRAR